MLTTKTAWGAAAALALASAGVALAVSTSAAAAGSTPGWEPDPNSVGGLTFYNAAGQQITGGQLTDAPLAAYVQGGATVRAGDTKATLFGYLPKNGQAPGAFTGEQLSGSTVYPNAAAPGPLGSSALPLLTGSAADEGIGGLAADLPNTDTTAGDGYSGLYQLRLQTTQAGKGANQTYDSADIAIDSAHGTWSVVYPAPALTSTTTALTTTPGSPQVAGTAVELDAAVSPAAPGTVQFEDGSTALGSPVTVSAGGTASISTSTLGTGSHTLKAVFSPAQFSAYSGSTGSAAFSVTAPPAAATTTSLSVNPTTAPADTSVALVATVSSGTTALGSGSGTVNFYDNGTTLLGSATVGAGGVASSSYGAFAQGTHSVTAQFVPSNATVNATSTSAPVTFTATAPQHAPATLDATVDIPAGTLTITTPYSPASPFDLGTAALDPSDGKYVASAPFGANSGTAAGNDGGVTVTDTRAGDLPWTASVTATDFADGATPADTINAENLSFTGVTAVQIQGNALQASNVQTTDVSSAALTGTPYATTDGGHDGVKGGPHPFATVSHGLGEVNVDGVFTLDAPTSTVNGVYTASLTFSII